MKFKKCSCCGKWFPLEWFGKHTHRCKICNRDNDWKRRYNITADQYFKILKQQENKCAICGKEIEDKMLHVDHNHKTGQIRALLCGRCNRALGLYEEDGLKDLPNDFKEYLERYDDEYKDKKCQEP